MHKYAFVSLATLLSTACTGNGDALGDADAGKTSSDDDGLTTTGLSAGSRGGHDGGADGTGGDEAGGCEARTFDLQLGSEAPAVMLVLDKSGSMEERWNHDADWNTPRVTRWDSLYHVVGSLMKRFEGVIHFGAQLFPSHGAYVDAPAHERTCLMSPRPEVPVGPDQTSAIMAALPPPHFTPAGGTPATAAVSQALEHLRELPDDRAKAILLITDGAANCDPDVPAGDRLAAYDEQLLDVVAEGFEQHDIPTFVVGISIRDEMSSSPAINAFESLSDVARLGGAPRAGDVPFYNTFNEDELMGALDSIAGKLECVMSFPSEPYDPDKVRLRVGGIEYGRVSDCTSGHGWAYMSPEGPHQTIELCGFACDDLQVARNITVDFQCG